MRAETRDLVGGQRVDAVYVVRERELRRKKNGEPWLRLLLGEKSGTVEAISWEEPEERYAVAKPGAVFAPPASSRSASAGVRRSSSRAAAGGARQLRPR